MTGVSITLDWVASAVGATSRAGAGGAVVGDVVTDSRTLKPGDLFVALRGPRFDGHAFAAEVLERGAVGVIVERGRAAGDAHAIEVEDTLAALQGLAHAVRKAVGTRVIAITGSAGKTTTKEAIAAVLATRYRVVKNKGNLNNHIGLPLSLMQLRTAPDVAVMELGMNHAGEISRLVAIAEPEVRVWTNVGDAHLGFFESADAIADAKAEILEGATADAVLVSNADDARVAARAGRFPGRTITFGESPGATVRALSTRLHGVQGVSADVATPAGTRSLATPLLGRGNMWNVLAATAVGLEFGLDLDAIAAEVARLQPADRRGVVRHLRDGITLVDDSYNSSPSALARALDVVAYEAHARRAVGVLGEMLELGEHARVLHEASGRAAAAAGLRRLFVVGGAAARAMADAAVAEGMPASAVSYFERSTEAAPAVVAAVEAGDLVLVKGSRGTRTDVIADQLVTELG
ncbi:MAG TPA: UDP-N-acetylmuramoyl-tripeptide--D-alanyl-D-alanine ligase [Vicinamibacterales bacterium]|nr:UDP-N-acetylmuramoyl-tripeptide--D-alanyl-D-alanine ligase [Vicinamibacterales bacterium]